MEVNKIILQDDVILDMTQDTAEDSDVVLGKTFHNAEGTQVTGTYVPNVQPLSVTVNGTYEVSDGVVGYSPITVAVQNTGGNENKLAQCADGSVTEILAEDLAGCTKIRNYAFSECSNLTEVTIPNSVTEVNAYAFQKCKNISVLNLPNSINKFGDYSFTYVGVDGEAEFTLEPTDVCSVGSGAFSFTNITKINGRFGIIGSYSFTSCYKLGEVCIDDCSGIGVYAFQNNESLTKISLRVNGGISSSAISGCKAVEEFVFHKDSNITNTDSYMFNGLGYNRPNPSNNVFIFDCRNSSFSTVASGAFASSSSSWMNKYMKIYLPSTVAQINSAAFSYTEGFEIYFTNTSPPTLSSTSTWNNSTNYKIFVPYNSADAYRTATNWSAQYDYIYGVAYENAFSQGETLPTINYEGYGLTWYSDAELTTLVTTVEDPTAMYYCVVSAEKLAYRINDVSSYNCNVTITDGNNMYTEGDQVLSGTTLTITTDVQDGYTPYIFTINEVDSDSGAEFTMIEDLSIAAIYHDETIAPIPSFSEADWANVRDIAKAGVISHIWNVGDTKSVTLSDGNTYTIRIADMKSGRYALADGTGKTNAVFEFVECLPTDYAMNTTQKEGVWCGGGWALCDMKNIVLDVTVWGMLSDDIKSVVSEITLNEFSITSPSPRESINKLFLIAASEYFGTAGLSSEGKNGCALYDRYEYYASLNTTSAGIKCAVNATTPVHWWTRSPYSNSSMAFEFVMSSGGSGSGPSATTLLSVAPFFAI